MLLRLASWAHATVRELITASDEQNLTPHAHAQGDIILVGLRDYQDEKADVILKCATVLTSTCPCMRCTAFADSVLHLHDCTMPTHDLFFDLAHRYMADEARSLKAYGELPDSSAFPFPSDGCVIII